MNLKAGYLESEDAVDATRLYGTLEWENRVPALYYLKKKYAHRDILCLGALYASRPSAEPPHHRRPMSGILQRPSTEDRTALEVAFN
jgi:hypothetical protein